jgi:hypothetical protein
MLHYRLPKAFYEQSFVSKLNEIHRKEIKKHNIE